MNMLRKRFSIQCCRCTEAARDIIKPPQPDGRQQHRNAIPDTVPTGCLNLSKTCMQWRRGWGIGRYPELDIFPPGKVYGKMRRNPKKWDQGVRLDLLMFDSEKSIGQA
jgi:hypothetical protein